MTNKRISDLSCNKEEFDKVKSFYESALKDSGHFSSMSYNSNTQNVPRNRNRNITFLYGSTHHIVKIWKKTLVNWSSSLWGNTSPKTANSIRFYT